MTATVRTLKYLATSAALGALIVTGASMTAQAQGVVRSEHGSWQIRCDNKAGPGVERCALMQSVTSKDNANVGLTVILLKTAKKNAVLLRVLAPLGVFLPGGLGLQIDKKNLGRTVFLRCVPNGCISETKLEKKILNRFKAGATATFVLFEGPKKGIGLPVSLKGFTAGFTALPRMGEPAKAVVIKPGVVKAKPKPKAEAPRGTTITKVTPLPTPGESGGKNESRMAPSKKAKPASGG